MINLNRDWKILTCILLWRQNQEILVSIEISQLLRPTFCNCWDFLGCRDLLLPSVEIETLDQDHVKTNWDPQAYIGYSMTTLKSANITSVSYRPRVHSKILATKYPRHKQTYCDKVPVRKTFFSKSWLQNKGGYNRAEIEKNWIVSNLPKRNCVAWKYKLSKCHF